MLLIMLEKVGLFHLADEPFVLQAVKVLTGLLVHEYVLLRDGQLPQRDELPVLVLLPRTNADIALHYFP